LFIIASSRKAGGQLRGGVVGTLMTNLGLELALREREIPLYRAAVGDRYVLEMMQEQGCNLGGESSGHIICLDRTSTGDGIVSALQVLAEMILKDKSLQELRSGMIKFPQHMINVPVSDTVQPAESDAVMRAVQQAEERLAGRGRVLLRPSGTEPVIRVMVEGDNESLVREQATVLAEAVTRAFGA
jgi:phosphoglucosamine mutase